MAKSNYQINWYEYIILGLITLSLSLAITFKWFSKMIDDKTYSELGASKTSGIAYAIHNLEQTNYRFFLVFIFVLISCLYFVQAYKLYSKKK